MEARPTRGLLCAALLACCACGKAIPLTLGDGGTAGPEGGTVDGGTSGGRAVWAVPGHATGASTAAFLAADATGRVALAGAFSGSWALSMDQRPATTGFLAVLDVSGNLLWVVVPSSGMSLASPHFDAVGNLVASGTVTGSGTLGSATLTSPPGTTAMFVARWDPKGALLSSKVLATVPASADPTATPAVEGDVAIAPDGTLIVAGAFNTPTVDFGAGAAASGATRAGVWNGFVAAYDATGTLLWGRVLPSASGASGRVAVSSGGQVGFTGTFSSSIDLGPGPRAAASALEEFFVVLDQKGNYVWSHTFPAVPAAAPALPLPSPMPSLVPSGPVADGAELVFAASFAGSVDFGAGAVTSMTPTDSDVAITRYLPDGTAAWSTTFVRAGPDDVGGLAVDDQHDIFVVATSADATQTGSPLDFVAFRLSSSGSSAWAWVAGAGSPGVVGAAAAWGGGALFVAGDLLGGSQLSLGPGVTLAPTGTGTGAGSMGDLFVARINP